MARATKEQSEATARTVLVTAQELFAKHGYEAVGLEQVAADAGVTRGAVYHHFGSKKGLFEAVLDEAQSQVSAAITQAAPGEGWDAIEAGCKAFLRASISPGVRRIMLVDAPAVLGWTTWRRSDARHSARLLEEGLESLIGPEEDRGAIAALLSGAMNEAAMWIAEGGDIASAERALSRVLRSLRSP